MNRENREAIEWEDTLTEKEKQFAEKVAAQRQTIKEFKKASEQNDLKSLLHALTLKDVPSEFFNVKEEFIKRSENLLLEEAESTLLMMRKGGDSILNLYSTKGVGVTALIRVHLHKKIVEISESEWIAAFKSWTDENMLRQIEATLLEKKAKHAPSRSDSERRVGASDEYERVVERLKDVQEELRKIELDSDRPTTTLFHHEITNVLEVFKRCGFVVKVKGMEEESHYVFRTPFRWEESHTHKLTKLQRLFARPVNRPTAEQMSRHFSTGMVECPLHPLLTLSKNGNEFTREWYERRFTYKEWAQLQDSFAGNGFKVLSSGKREFSVLHQNTGHKATFYPNGHVYVSKGREALNTIEGQIGVLPFLWDPSFRGWLNLVVNNTMNPDG